MFDKIKKWIGGIWNAMLGKNVIQEAMNVEIAMTTQQSNRIERWISIAKGEPPWLCEEYPYTMNLGAAIANKFAKMSTLEFKSEIINNDFLNEEYQREVVNNIRNTVQFACGGGAICFKPYLTLDKHIAVDIVQADNFYPVSFLRGQVTACILPEFKIKGDYTYTRLESHAFNSIDRTYTIENKAFKKKNFDMFGNPIGDDIIGDEIPLNSVEEWANLAPSATLTNIDQPLFVYFKMPIANTKNPQSKLGVSIFADIAEVGYLLEQADKQYSRALWEYEGGELAIHASNDMFKKSIEDTREIYEIPSGKKRLYRQLDVDYTAPGNTGKPLDIFSPAFRDTALFNGLNKLIQQIEIQVGLAKGTFSDVQEIAKTATEVSTTKQDSYQTVKDIQNNLTIALKQLGYAMYVWAKIGGLPVNPINPEKDMNFDYDDSILIDRQSELQSMQTDVSLGILDPVYYIMEKYKKTEQEARKMIPQQQIIKPDPFATSQE